MPSHVVVLINCTASAADLVQHHRLLSSKRGFGSHGSIGQWQNHIAQHYWVTCSKVGHLPCHASHVNIPCTVSAYCRCCRTQSIGVMHCSNQGCVPCLRNWYTAHSHSDVLSSACSAMRRTGAVTFNGQKLNKRFKRQIGFVMQVTPCCIALCIYVVLYLSSVQSNTYILDSF